MTEAVEAQLLVDVLQEQRNKALDGVALATARSVAFQAEIATLKARIAELEAELKKKE